MDGQFSMDEIERRIASVEIMCRETHEISARVGDELRNDLRPRIISLEKVIQQDSTELAVIRNDYAHRTEMLNDIKVQGRDNAKAIDDAGEKTAQSISTLVLALEQIKSDWKKQFIALLATAGAIILGALWVYLKGGGNVG